LWVKGLNAEDIHKEMFPVYGGKCLSGKAVHNWVEKFSQGRSKFADDARSYRPVLIATVAPVKRVEELIRADRRITIDSVATALGCSHGLAHSIMRDGLKFRKMCARRVPRELKDRENMNRMGLSLQHLATTAKIPGKVADATSCPHSKNELMLLSEYKNVTICLLLTYNL
jgi:hypothetical protein